MFPCLRQTLANGVAVDEALVKGLTAISDKVSCSLASTDRRATLSACDPTLACLLRVDQVYPGAAPGPIFDSGDGEERHVEFGANGSINGGHLLARTGWVVVVGRG